MNFVNTLYKICMKNRLKETTGSEKKRIEHGLFLERNKSIGDIIESMNVIHKALMDNRNVSQRVVEEIMKDIQDNFKNTQVDLYGQKVDMDFMRKHGKVIKENQEI